MNAIELVRVGLLGTRDPVTIILVLAFLAIAIATPFSIILSIGGYSRHTRELFPALFLIAPVFEELVFRWYLLAMPLAGFEPITAIAISTALYTVYMNIAYGTPAMAEGIVTGIIFGFAFLQFGIVPVILAHIIYRAVLYVW
jgi:membrane protease YdiL (CAAX protease family)